jgi:hypothetical protein
MFALWFVQHNLRESIWVQNGNYLNMHVLLFPSVDSAGKLKFPLTESWSTQYCHITSQSSASVKESLIIILYLFVTNRILTLLLCLIPNWKSVNFSQLKMMVYWCACFQCQLSQTEWAGVQVSTLNLGQFPSCSDWDLSWFFSASPDKS